MNLHSPQFLTAAAGLVLAATMATGAPVDRFVRTQERIDALVKRRLNPPPLPPDLPNPFLLSGRFKIPDGADTDASGGQSPTTSPGQTPATPAENLPPPGSDAEALARYIAKLKISGTVHLNGRTQLVINQTPYKEGDLILIGTKDATTYLQVIRISSDELTLGLNEAVQTVKFKGF